MQSESFILKICIETLGSGVNDFIDPNAQLALISIKIEIDIDPRWNLKSECKNGWNATQKYIRRANSSASSPPP